MNALLHFSLLMLRLNFRQPMAVLYGYVFPLIFLAAFAIIYRHDPRPVGAHIGQLLTVTALGGACFGLPTAMVGERERGIWKRYRVTGAPTYVLLGGVVSTRLFLLVSAALMQLAIAIAFGMSLPGGTMPFALAFLATCLCLIGLGMVIALLVDSVVAVQALGQCIFLPMLMLGGIAVRPETLPHWLQVVAASLPGIHAVRAIQDSFDGDNTTWIASHLIVLSLYAVAGACAAAALFRWDSRARPVRKLALMAAGGFLLLAGAAGQIAEDRGSNKEGDRAISQPEDYLSRPPKSLQETRKRDVPPTTVPAQLQVRPEISPSIEAGPIPSPIASAAKEPVRWQDVDDSDIARIAFDRLPDDAGLISPLAARGTLDDPATQNVIRQVRDGLPDWAPAAATDPVQRVRNLLYVAAVPDVLQMDPLERHLPWLVFDRLRQDIPPDNLRRILFWISQHPDEGQSDAVSAVTELGLPTLADSSEKVRERAMIYALKLLRLIERTRAPDQ